MLIKQIKWRTKSIRTSFYSTIKKYSKRHSYKINLKYYANAHKLSKMYNMYKGNRCFIIGNGPSLRKMDLSLLKNEYTFGLNRIYLLFDELGFIPTFYVVVNDYIVKQFITDIEKIDSIKFMMWRHRRLVRNKRNVFFLVNKQGPYFGRNIVKGIYEGATVTYVALQIAFYMGFSTVILIGIDHNYKVSGRPHELVVQRGYDVNHFSEHYFGPGVMWQLPDLEESELAYRMAKFVYERDGRTVLDATINGKLQVFRKIDYYSLFEKE